jgi:glycosyltransferase involved in cell wall biosynthesis
VSLRRTRYDVIHADAAIAGVRADVLVVHTISARWLRLPREIWREPGLRGANEAAATRFKAALELRQARRARHVVANSAMTAGDLAAAGVERERVTIVPFGVDASRFTPPTGDERAAARARFGIDPGAFVAASVGPLGPRKGFPLVIEALAGGDAVLLAAGDQRGHWLAEARARGVRIIAPGKTDDVRAVYHAADVLAYPSRYDAFGMAVLEAMACGLPVIVSPETGSHDLVDGAGIVLERTDTAHLRAAIERVREEAGARAAMSERARAIALTRPWDETGASIIKLYRRLG